MYQLAIVIALIILIIYVQRHKPEHVAPILLGSIGLIGGMIIYDLIEKSSLNNISLKCPIPKDFMDRLTNDPQMAAEFRTFCGNPSKMQCVEVYISGSNLDKSNSKNGMGENFKQGGEYDLNLKEHYDRFQGYNPKAKKELDDYI